MNKNQQPKAHYFHKNATAKTIRLGLTHIHFEHY